jgi:hypothetical protein
MNKTEKHEALEVKAEKAEAKAVERTEKAEERAEAKAEKEKEKEKEKVLKQIQDILNDHGGLESNIGIPNEYWQLKNIYRGLEDK